LSSQVRINDHANINLMLILIIFAQVSYANGGSDEH